MPLALQLRFGFIGAAIDVTDRRRTEAAMKAGAVDYVLFQDEASLREGLARALVEARATAARPSATKAPGQSSPACRFSLEDAPKGYPIVQARGRRLPTGRLRSVGALWSEFGELTHVSKIKLSAVDHLTISTLAAMSAFRGNPAGDVNGNDGSNADGPLLDVRFSGRSRPDGVESGLSAFRKKDRSRRHPHLEIPRNFPA